MANTSIVYEVNQDSSINEITMSDAIRKLSGHWEENKIEDMLMQGLCLFTPFSNYTIKNPIRVTFDTYGNEDYGKRVYWIEGTNNYVWKDDFKEWKKEQENDGYIVIEN